MGTKLWSQIYTRIGDAAATVNMSVAFGQIWHLNFPPFFPSDHVHPVTWVRSADQGSADIFPFSAQAPFYLFTSACHATGDGACRSLPPPKCAQHGQVLFAAVGPVVVNHK